MKIVLPLAVALALAPVQLVRAQAPTIEGKRPYGCAKALPSKSERATQAS